MTPDHLTYRIINRLRAPGAPLSRNRHFSVFDTPEGRLALRIHRRVRAVENELLSHEHEALISMGPAGGEMIRIGIELRRLRAKRTSYLTRAELAILLESRVGHLFSEAREDEPLQETLPE